MLNNYNNLQGDLLLSQKQEQQMFSSMMNSTHYKKFLFQHKAQQFISQEEPLVSEDHCSEYISGLVSASLFCSSHQYLWLVFISILLIEVYVQVRFHLEGPSSSFSDTPRSYGMIQFHESHGVRMILMLKVMLLWFSCTQKKDWDCSYGSLSTVISRFPTD